MLSMQKIQAGSRVILRNDPRATICCNQISTDMQNLTSSPDEASKATPCWTSKERADSKQVVSVFLVKVQTPTLIPRLQRGPSPPIDTLTTRCAARHTRRFVSEKNQLKSYWRQSSLVRGGVTREEAWLQIELLIQLHMILPWIHWPKCNSWEQRPAQCKTIQELVWPIRPIKHPWRQVCAIERRVMSHLSLVSIRRCKDIELEALSAARRNSKGWILIVPWPVIMEKNIHLILRFRAHLSAVWQHNAWVIETLTSKSESQGRPSLSVV